MLKRLAAAVAVCALVAVPAAASQLSVYDAHNKLVWAAGRRRYRGRYIGRISAIPDDRPIWICDERRILFGDPACKAPATRCL